MAGPSSGPEQQYLGLYSKAWSDELAEQASVVFLVGDVRLPAHKEVRSALAAGSMHCMMQAVACAHWACQLQVLMRRSPSWPPVHCAMCPQLSWLLSQQCHAAAAADPDAAQPRSLRHAG